MTRFIAALVLIVLMIGAVAVNRTFINDVYSGLDERLKKLETSVPSAKRENESELYDYWQSKLHLCSFTVKESDLRGFTSVLAKLKVCSGDEYLSALTSARVMANELGKTESMSFFDLF